MKARFAVFLLSAMSGLVAMTATSGAASRVNILCVHVGTDAIAKVAIAVDVPVDSTSSSAVVFGPSLTVCPIS